MKEEGGCQKKSFNANGGFEIAARYGFRTFCADGDVLFLLPQAMSSTPTHLKEGSRFTAPHQAFMGNDG